MTTEMTGNIDKQKNNNANSQLIKQDINFFEYPLWRQTTRNIKYLQEFTDIEGFRYVATQGTPNKVDIKILYSLMLESQQHNWAETIKISKFKILKMCNMGTNARMYKRLDLCLRKWKSVEIEFKGIFYDGHNYSTFLFNIIDSIGWHNDKKNDKNLTIRFSPEYLNKIKKSEYFKYIDFNQLLKLNSPLALRLYEILSKTFYKRQKWEISVTKLAKKIPMQEKYVAHIIAKIKPAVNRINKSTDLKVTVEVVNRERNQGKFIFKKKNIEKSNSFSKANKQDIQFQPEIKSELQPEPAEYEIEIKSKNYLADSEFNEIMELIPAQQRNGALSVCQKIFDQHGKEGLKFYIQQAQKINKNINNYGGYLQALVKIKLYESHLKDLEYEKARRIEREKQIQEMIQAQKIQTEKEQEYQEALEIINNLTFKKVKELDAFIEKQDLNKFNRQRFVKGNRDLLRVRYVRSFLKNQKE